jgi:phytoene dehydrogenase-like protein
MDTNFYDVIVCGGETAGLCAGALLARRGFRVMLLGHEPASAAFEAGGVTLSAAPALLPPLDEPPTARVLKELDVTAHAKRKTAAADVSFRLVLPGQRLDVMRDRALQERELGRAFGAAGGSVGVVMDRLADAARLLDPLFASAITLPPNGFWERREVGRLRSLLPKPTTDLFAPLPAEHPFRVMAALPAVHGAAVVAHDVGPIGEARAFEIARRGQLTFEGGLAALQALLLARLEMFGADRREHVTPVEIVVRRGRIAGVRVSPRDETIGCHHLLWAGSAAGLAAALPPGAIAPHKRPQPARVTGYRYSIAALVEPDALPADLPPRLLAIADPSRALTEDNALAVTIGQPNPRDPRRIPVWIECGVPASLAEAGASYLRSLRGRVTHVLRRLLPAFAEHMVVLGSPYDGLPAEHRGTPAPETTPLASMPSVPPPALISAASSGPLDIIGRPHATAIKHLYLVGRENLPGLGLEGELISGWGVARLMSAGPARKHLSPRRILISS